MTNASLRRFARPATLLPAAALLALSLGAVQPLTAQADSEGYGYRQGYQQQDHQGGFERGDFHGGKGPQGRMGDHEQRGGRRGGPMKPGGFCDDERAAEHHSQAQAAFQGLNLTAEQQGLLTQLNAAEDAVRAAMVPLCDKLDALKEAKDKLHEERQALGEEMKAGRDELRDARQAFMQSLDDSQRKALREAMPKPPRDEMRRHGDDDDRRPRRWMRGGDN